MRLHGVDFTSAPRRRKPIAIASGRLLAQAAAGAVLAVDGIERIDSLDGFDDWLRRPGPWLAAFDLPFGLPRELLTAFDWPRDARDGDTAWSASIRHVVGLGRAEFVDRLRAFCASRPAGAKFAHRAADRPAGSSPSMKWVNPPVALMLHAGAPRLLEAGVSLPGLHPGDPSRIALEGYPGFVARSIVGRESYKSDQRARQTARRRAARERIVSALTTGSHRLGVPALLGPALRRECVDDASADSLDAVLCLLQAAWAWQRRDQGFGLPGSIDPVEGWIVSVPSDDRVIG